MEAPEIDVEGEEEKEQPRWMKIDTSLFDAVEEDETGRLKDIVGNNLRLRKRRYVFFKFYSVFHNFAKFYNTVCRFYYDVNYSKI